MVQFINLFLSPKHLKELQFLQTRSKFSQVYHLNSMIGQKNQFTDLMYSNLDKKLQEENTRVTGLVLDGKEKVDKD